MMLLVLLALSQTPTSITLSAHGHGHGFQGMFVGNSIELEAHVFATTFGWGSPRPTGTVTFTDITDGTPGIVLGIASIGGWGWRNEAEIFWTPAAARTYNIEADFTSANPAFANATATIQVGVNPAITHTHITPHFSYVLASSGVANFTVNLSTGFGFSWRGRSIPVPETIDITSTAGTVVTSPVTTDGNGNATFQVTGLTTVGTYFVTASFAGDGNYSASSDTATVNVVTTLPPYYGYSGGYSGFWHSSYGYPGRGFSWWGH